jgi:hypothetical protein
MEIEIKCSIANTNCIDLVIGVGAKSKRAKGEAVLEAEISTASGSERIFEYLHATASGTDSLPGKESSRLSVRHRDGSVRPFLPFRLPMKEAYFSNGCPLQRAMFNLPQIHVD